jgi:hypothetical protein
MKEEWGMADGMEFSPIELPFYASDSEDLYNQNLTDNFYDLEKNGWKHHAPLLEDRVVGYKYDYNPEDPMINDWVNLSYRMNSHGFRGEGMPTESKKRSVLCLGDENTFGVGMPEGKLWTTLVGQTMKVRAYNLGMINGNMESAFRVLMYWLPKIKPQHVFLLEPAQGYEYHTKDGLTRMNHAFFATTEDNWVMRKEAGMRAIKSLCDQFDTPLTIDDGCSDDYFSLFREHDLARDLKHFGSKRHIHIAMTMLKKSGYEWDV